MANNYGKKYYLPILVVFLGFFVSFFPNISHAAEEKYVTTVDNFIDDYPYRRSNLRQKITIMWNDGSNSYDFWKVVAYGQTVPGYVLAGNTWRAEEATFGQEKGQSEMLLDFSFDGTRYGPTTTSDNVGFQAGAPQGTATISNSYTVTTQIPDYSVRSLSDFSIERGRWYLQLEGDFKQYTNTFTHSTNWRVSQNASLTIKSYNSAIFDSVWGIERPRTQIISMNVKKPIN